ncbi:Golgi-associated plant pathogenesis-related protein 1-like, partial [Cochliomyia hominivorax]
KETRNKNRFGENIFYTSDQQIEGQEPVVYWYNGIKDYDFQRPGYSPATAGFTQVIWKNSKQLGVGIAKFGYSTYVVCNYDPKGNILDKYSENVLPLIGVDASASHEKHLTFEVDSFANEMLKWHNYYRMKHESPLLELSPELMDYCKKYANHLIDNKPFNEIPQYAVSTLSFSENRPTAEEIVSNWYKEIEKYDFLNPQYQNDTKHFTQIVWKNTKFMGVGESKRQGNAIVVVCYEPSGNIEQQYAENVTPTI